MAAQALYATPEDIRARFEGDVDDERAWTLLHDVETRLGARVPDLLARIAASKTTSDAVRLVVVTAALRVIRNPGGFRTETTPDYAYSVDQYVSSGYILFTADDLLLLGIRGAKRVGAIQLGIPAWQQS